MLISCYEECGTKPHRNKRFLVCKCDICGQEFTRRYQLSLANAERHYHNRTCYSTAKRKDGPADVATKSTNKTKYGVACTFQAEDVAAKIEQTMLLRYGVKHPVLIKENLSKLNSISKVELQFFDALRQIYGFVEHTKFINNWKIDFYIDSISTYVQLDGVYWHGLDRTLEQIMMFKNKRDYVIYETILRDLRQNEWFGAKGLKLKRITDIEFQTMTLQSLKCFLEL
jgi:hypothetical protein